MEPSNEGVCDVMCLKGRQLGLLFYMICIRYVGDDYRVTSLSDNMRVNLNERNKVETLKASRLTNYMQLCT